MLAFHNDPKIKAKYLRRVRAHVKADQLVQGYGYWEDGKGCAVGCTLHSDDHDQYPIELGIPAELAYLEDHFFEKLPVDLARQWPARFLKAAKPGADLSRVYDLWSAWNLIDPTDGVINLVSDDYPDIRRIVRETGEACLAGNRVDEKKSEEAERASEATWATWASEVARAPRASQAAEAAEAAWAAEATWAVRAAGAEKAARAPRASGAKYYRRASDKLIELMEAADVKEGM